MTRDVGTATPAATAAAGSPSTVGQATPRGTGPQAVGVLEQLAGLEVLKGHGTGNDFVLVPDLSGWLDLTAQQVQALTDRRFGLGGDGVLRVVPTAKVAEHAEHAHEAPWFMDYRNADGSVAEMCGNGARVFARYLVDEGLETHDEFAIATRGGVRQVRLEKDGEITLEMGRAQGSRLRAMPVVRTKDGTTANGTAVFVPNPHCVVLLDDADTLDAVDLTTAPEVAPAAVFPDGVNVELVVRVGERHVRLRVHERGVGETLSCGTGAVAVGWAMMLRDEAPQETTCTVDVPGGRVLVTRRADDRLELTGPAVIVARGRIGGAA